jgi:hypothetical protein
MPTCPTVKIQNGDGFMTINADKFDPKRHKIYGEPEAKPKPAKRPYKRKKVS